MKEEVNESSQTNDLTGEIVKNVIKSVENMNLSQ